MTYNFEDVSILIVDDMSPMLSLLSSILRSFGFNKIYTAKNGNEAFQIFCKHDPDIILTDWVMPMSSGLKLTEMIRKDPLSPNPYTPIIMMTGFSSRRHALLARDHGATEFLVKPFSANDLYLRIKQVIEKPRQFVDTEKFFGPDRRRRPINGFEGNLKRETDTRTKVKTEIAQNISTMELLERMRRETQNIVKDKR